MCLERAVPQLRLGGTAHQSGACVRRPDSCIFASPIPKSPPLKFPCLREESRIPCSLRDIY